jgi:hypothetical protein
VETWGGATRVGIFQTGGRVYVVGRFVEGGGGGTVRFMSNRTAAGVTGLLLTGVLTSVGAAQGAAAAPAGAPSVHFLSNGTVRGGGAAAIVRLAVRCARSSGSFVLEFNVRQPAGAAANGFATGVCTGKKQVVTAPVEAGAVPEDAPFDASDLRLSSGPAKAQAYTMLCDDNGCDEVLYPPQPVTLTDSSRLDRHKASDGQTTYRFGKRWRLTRGGKAAVATLRITCPDGVTVPLDSLELWSAGSVGHVQRSASVVSFPPPAPTVRCNGKAKKVRVRLLPADEVPGQHLHAGAGLAHFFVNDVEAWGQVRLRHAAVG